MASSSLLLLLSAIPCLSHKRLSIPTPRDTATASRTTGPCGPVSFEEAYANGDITEWTAGETVEIVIYEQIHHSREPMRLAISDENDEDFESCIWLNHIPQHTTGEDLNLHIELTVPDMTCKNCTLQLIGFQTSGRSESNCCLYHPDCENEYGDSAGCCGTSQYFSCANINIVGGSRSREDVCKQPNDWGFRNFTCNYFMAEESDNAWTTNNDGSLSLITSGLIDGLDPTASSHCDGTDFEVAVDTECQSFILAEETSSGSSGSSGAGSSSNNADEMASLVEGGAMKGDGVFAVIVVIILAISITATYCLTKNKTAKPGLPVPNHDAERTTTGSVAEGMATTTAV